ncbi:hypothetical protein CY34DRAFT_708625 [Suillus luteus UH-Slu-Lm8-n1]|uniref:Uncharacterized protein n=1 Tax=Suillus luteus UH-Slu-Lm8-n1 TaxID=930992 RepID=A0A0D0BJX1_9AGAM|nr:hypothetical protein CY34DRAFT_708625 [Suillus luteus UH-Slu-Lm8-n1]
MAASGSSVGSASKDSTMGPLVKPNVSSSALKTQMRFWCYREVPVIALSLMSDEFLNLCIVPCMLPFTAIASPRFSAHSPMAYHTTASVFCFPPNEGPTPVRIQGLKSPCVTLY